MKQIASLFEKHVEKRLIRASVRLDGTFVDFAVLVHGLHGIGVAGDDFAGRFVLDFERLCDELGCHLIAENDVEYGIAASVGRNDGHFDIFAADIAFDEIREESSAVLLKRLSFDENLIDCYWCSLTLSEILLFILFSAKWLSLPLCSFLRKLLSCTCRYPHGRSGTANSPNAYRLFARHAVSTAIKLYMVTNAYTWTAVLCDFLR